MIKRPVLRYFGGKWKTAPWIIDHFPEHRVYVEPFGGAASVLLRKKRSYAEVYNDLDFEVVNLFQVLRDQKTAKRLEELLRLTPFARAEFMLSSKETKDPIERARRTIIRSFMGFGADSVSNPSKTTGFRSDSNKLGTTPAHDWTSYPDCIKPFTERLLGVVIENRPAQDLFLAHDTPETLFYVDPPYVAETRTKKRTKNYKHELSDDDHINLLKSIKALVGMVVISGYEHPIYEYLGWTKFKKNTYADGANERVECLWVNPAAVNAKSQIEMCV